MKSAFIVLGSGLIVFALSNGARGELRTWTDRTGRQIEAELSRGTETSVRLWSQGKMISVWIKELSEADQRYVRDIRAGKKSLASEFGAAASAEGNTDNTAQTPEAAHSLPQKPAAQGGVEAPALNGIAHGELRTWTARNGKYTVVAEFVSGDARSVTLGSDGKQRTVPLAALCDADQQFVRDSLAAESPTTAQGHAPTKTAADGPAVATSFSVCGIQAGMSFQEIVPILKARGMRLSDPGKVGSALFNISARHAPARYYPGYVSAGRQDGEVLTKLDIRFREDLPDRPGVGICQEVTFSKVYVGNGSPDLSSWFQQARDELVQRYGPPTDDDEKYPEWRHHDSESLQLDVSISSEVSVCLRSEEVERRSNEGKEILIERFRPTAPVVKLDF